MIVLAVLAFAWPAARIAPRHLPVGLVGTGPASQQVLSGLTRSDPGGFDVQRYADEASARSAIEDRDVYGAFAVGAGGITVLEASAASPAVAQLLSTAASASPPSAPRRAACHSKRSRSGTSTSSRRRRVTPAGWYCLLLCCP